LYGTHTAAILSSSSEALDPALVSSSGVVLGLGYSEHSAPAGFVGKTIDSNQQRCSTLRRKYENIMSLQKSN
jgi:hypothetical protein